jgi:chromosome segregation ATPase
VELEKVKKDKNLLAGKVRELEVRNQGLCAELESVQMERNRLKIRETPNINFSKTKEKTRKYKEKFLEIQEKLEKTEEIRKKQEETLKNLNQNLKEKLEIIDEKDFFIKEIQALTNSLKSELTFSQNSLKQQQDALTHAKSSSSQTIKSLTQSKTELVAQYESKIQQLQQESSEKVSKTAEDILSQLDQIEVEYKGKLEEIIKKLGSSNEKVSSLTLTLSDLTEQNSLLQSSYQKLSEKYLQLEEEFQKKQEEFKKIYNEEVSQHKSDVLALECEVQKLYENKSSSDFEVLNEKYKILKAEYFEVQQQLHLNKTFFDQQFEDFKKKNNTLDASCNEKLSNVQQDLLKAEERVEELLTENRKVQEEKIKTRVELENTLQTLQLERKKTGQVKEMVKISLKQMKNEFFQSVKLAHRGIFEELLICKKFLSENSSVLASKIATSLKSWSGKLEASFINKKQLHEHYIRDCEGLNEIRLQVSQLERELRIKEDRIFYLETSLKSSLSRSRPDFEFFNALLQQVSNLEANFSESLKELVDMIVYLKAVLSKEHMEHLKELEDRLAQKDHLLKQVRLELLKPFRAST